jgi:hypothetical protein
VLLVSAARTMKRASFTAPYMLFVVLLQPTSFPAILRCAVLLQAAPSAAWEVLLPAAGHFQYLDSTTALQRAVCGGGADGPDDAAVRAVSQAALVAWGEAMVKLPGRDVVSSIAGRCSSLGLPRGAQTPARNSSSSNSSNAVGEGTDSWWQPSVDSLAVKQQAQPSQQLDWRQQLQLSDDQLVRAADAAASLGSRQQQSLDSSLQEQRQLHASSRRPLQQQQQQLEAVQSSSNLDQQQLAALPRVQTRQELWLAARAPPPSVLQALQADLERLLVAVSYQSAATLEVRTQFKNFG